MGDLDEEVGEASVIVALAAGHDVFAVTEAAAGHDERDVAGAMGAGVAEVAARHDDRVVEQRAAAFLDAFEQAEEAVRLVTARADAGSSTQLEVLSAQTALKLSRTQYSQALRDYTVARAKLERAMGEGVRLVIETGSR